MSHPLHIFRDPALDGPANMARDEHLLHSVWLRPAALRLYAWKPPTLSLGYFQRHADLASLPPDLRSLPVVRRPTGGGAILHDRELTYCLTIDDSLPSASGPPAGLYRLVHECWKDALVSGEFDLTLAPDDFPLPGPRTGPFFCFEKPGRTDLLRAGVKVLGSAQRRIPGRVLQHGSLLLGRRFAAHPGGHLDSPPSATVDAWIDAFIARLSAVLNLRPQPTTWAIDQLADVADRRQRYASAAWTRRH